jgi:membrane-bound lytic murein transglycosylase MltF
MRYTIGVPLVLATVSIIACGGGPEPAAKQAQAPPASAADAAASPAPADDSDQPAPEATPLPDDLPPLLQSWTGDLDGMVKRRLVRVLTVQSPVLYFVDKGREAGVTYETIKAFEKDLNQKLGNKLVLVHVVPIPVARDRLLPGLLEGRGDIAAASLTITPERRKKVDFSEPIASDVPEMLVTGPAAPAVAGVDDLSGKEVYVRAASSYAESLRELNKRFAAAGKAPVKINPAPETLEVGDILEMVNAGLVPMTVADGYMANLYAKVFDGLKVRPDVTVRTGGEIAWAFRKNSPQLQTAANAFLKTHRAGTLAGNVVINKYLKNTKWVKNANGAEDAQRFRSMIDLFQKYGKKYDMDWLLMAAQGYQESGLDQKKRSHVGAIGVMQVMPATARDKAVAIPNIENLESNIHAGIKYIRWVVDNYYNDPSMSRLDRGLFAFASYNAGPGRVAGLRREAAAAGLDPNKWFNNVELIAAKRIGRETVQYVSNIYKYYLAYKMLIVQRDARNADRKKDGN